MSSTFMQLSLILLPETIQNMRRLRCWVLAPRLLALMTDQSETSPLPRKLPEGIDSNLRRSVLVWSRVQVWRGAARRGAVLSDGVVTAPPRQARDLPRTCPGPDQDLRRTHSRHAFRGQGALEQEQYMGMGMANLTSQAADRYRITNQ